MLYRPHRGSLAAAMRECVEVSGVADILDIINTQNAIFGVGPVGIEAIAVEKYSYDARILWDTHIVTVNGCAVGFTDGPAA